MSLVHLYAQIEKSESQDDGTLKVWGYASSESIDSQNEIVSAGAMKAALPEYMKFGAVREMHQPMAAGTAIEAAVQADGRTWFGAHIVDPIAVKKVQTKTYKGFSIGGTITSRDATNKSMVTGLKLTEISLVDRPANPDSVFELWKADMITNPTDLQTTAVDELAEIINKGEITPSELIALYKASKVPAVDLVAGDQVEKAKGGIVYADPKNEKYPLDTEKHIRAAWSYIHQAKNDKEYSAKEVQEIKDAIIAAWKETIDKDGPPSAQDDKAKSDEVVDLQKSDEPVAKGMYTVQDFADMLSFLASMYSSTEAEASIEGDNSPVPAQLKSWLADGIKIFQAMAIEESTELMGQVQNSYLSLSAKNTSVNKAGARNSAEDQTAIQTAHDALVQAGAVCTGTPAMDSNDNLMDGKSDGVANLQKVDETIAKLGDSLKKVLADNESLQKRLKVLEDKPEAPKGKLMVVGKGDDFGVNDDSAIEEVVVKNNDGSVNAVASELKKAHQLGGHKIARM